MRGAKGTKGFEISKVKFPCYASIKYDGIRVLRKVIGGTPQLYSRNHNVLIGADHIKPEYIKGYTGELDGEGMYAGDDFDSASGKWRNHEMIPNAYYMVFDAPAIPGNFETRYNWLKDYLIENDHLKLVEHVLVKDIDELMDFYFKSIEAGHEGIVVKDPKSPYNDKKNYQWMRMVPIKTSDCEVIGVEEGTGKFEGSMGKLIVKFQGKECKVGTGFNEKPWADLTPAERRKAIKDGKGEDGTDYETRRRGWIYNNPNAVIGKIACCEYKELSKNGLMRQPRFKGWRWDKKEVD